MRNFKWPWEKRAERLARERREAELRLKQTREDWERLRKVTTAVHREVILNDWTATAKRMFMGDSHGA